MTNDLPEIAIDIASSDNLIGEIRKTIADYRNQAALNRNSYRILKVVQIICAIGLTLIPAFVNELGQVVLGSSIFKGTQLSATLTAIILASEAFSYFGQLRGNWLAYQQSADLLESELQLFRWKAGAYRSLVDSALLFVERTQQIIGAGNKSWLDYELRIASSEYEKFNKLSTSIPEKSSD